MADQEEPMHPMTRRVLFTGFVLVILCARSVAAQTSFYEGKTITMLRGSQACVS